MSTDLIQQRQAIIDGVLSGNADQFLEQWCKVLPEKEYPVYVPVPQEKNNADLAIERAQAKLADKKATAGAAEPPAPPTNAQRAAYIAHQGGVRAFGQFFTELLDRIETLEARQNGHDAFVDQLVQQKDALAKRVAELEAANKSRRPVAA
jgi:hypothetical protein